MLQPNQRRLFRSVDTKDFRENGQLNFDMPLGYDLNRVKVKMTGTITVGTAPTAYHDNAVLRLIKRIDLLSNGKSKYAELSGIRAALLNFERKLAKQITDVAAGTGAKTVEAHFYIDLTNPDGVRPKDSALHTISPFMTKLQLQINCGAMVDMFKTAGSGAISSFDLDVEVEVDETIEYNDAAYFENRLVKSQSLIEETIDATKTNHKVKLSTGNLMTRGVILYALDENGALSNSIINTIQLKSGVDVPFLQDGNTIRATNISDYGLNEGQLPDGVYFADLCPDGKLSQLWDTRNRSELDLVMDVTKPAGGDATVYIFPVQFYEQNNAEVRSALGI